MLAPTDLGLPEKFGSWRETPNWSQWDTIADLASQATDTVIYQGPTGSGKSLAGMATLAMHDFRRAVYLTGTKQLQDQLAGDFAHPVLKGRQNYSCRVLQPMNKWATADQGPCTSGWKCPVRGECEYYRAKGDAEDATISVQNYAFFLAESNYAFMSPWRLVDLVIADECHELEKWLLNFVSIDLHDSTFGRLEIEVPRLSTPSDYYAWALLIKPRVLTDRARAMEACGIFFEIDPDSGARKMVIPEGAMNRPEWRVFQTASSIARNLTNLVAWLEPRAGGEQEPGDGNGPAELEDPTPVPSSGFDRVDEDWVLRPIMGMVKGRGNHRFADKEQIGVQLLPVWVRQFAKPFFFAHARKHLLMSATILRPELLARTLGLEPGEFSWVESPSIFPKANRPLFVAANLKMSAGDQLQQSLPILASIVDDVLDNRYPNRKGIIHTGNYKIARYLLEHCRSRRLLGYESGGLEGTLEHFRGSSDPLVLVGPSLHTGVDLPGMVGFQILAKLPFPDLGDEQTRRRRVQDPEWYEWVTACSLVQAYGRGVRTMTDQCDTWITDAAFKFFHARNKGYLPTWFRQAIEWNPPL
jgi:Rad3-related DNA helicase